MLSAADCQSRINHDDARARASQGASEPRPSRGLYGKVAQRIERRCAPKMAEMQQVAGSNPAFPATEEENLDVFCIFRCITVAEAMQMRR